MNSPELSIVSPVFRAAPIVQELVRQIIAGAQAASEDFEIILVDDDSPDESWAQIVAACTKEPRVKGLRLSRNFGQHRAVTAGLAQARGAFVVVMDCDLQDDPRYIRAMLDKAKAGFDVVLGLRAQRRHSWFRNQAAALYYRLFNALTEQSATDKRISGFSLINRKVVDAFLRIGDTHRHYLLILGWMGFRTGTVPVEHRPRYQGKSSYGLRRLIGQALEGVTSQSIKLLRIAIGVGFAYALAAGLGVIYLICSYYLHGYLAGWASTFVLLLGSTSLILISIGILGIYIGNIFEQVRARPLYLVQEQINFESPVR